MPALSVLDLIPVRKGQTSADALQATFALARTADELGYHRYWVAEHHNTESIVSTNPPVLMGMIAARTERIRVGSGGVMLPNHSPLVIAEQVALLEAAHPGRIDLGLGRAPGTDQLTRFMLRGREMEAAEAAVDRFPEYVRDIAMMMRPEGVELSYGQHRQSLRATANAATVAQTWLLGSSDYAARLAAQMGLPYVFAHHFGMGDTAQALALYRERYQPSEEHPEPRTFLTVNASVAEDPDEAYRNAIPYMQTMIALRTGAKFEAQRSLEDAVEVGIPEPHRLLAAAMVRKWIIGDPATAKQAVVDLAAEYGVDEVMVQPIAGDSLGSPLDRAPARETTLRLLMS